MTVGDLLRRASSKELSEWRVYFQILASENTSQSTSVSFRGQPLPE